MITYTARRADEIRKNIHYSKNKASHKENPVSLVSIENSKKNVQVEIKY